MPLDAVCLSAVVRELQETLPGRTIDKIHQPGRDMVILSLRGGLHLLMSAASGQARCHYTTLHRENPAVPPRLCVLLRRHMLGGRIAALTQLPRERVIRLEVDIRNELGESGRRTLVWECLGSRANLLLLDGQERIIDCLKRLEPETGRAALPGLFYHPPEPQEKLDPATVSPEELTALLAQAGDMDATGLLLAHFRAMSPLVCRELACRALGAADGRLFGVKEQESLMQTFFAWQEMVQNGRFTPFQIRWDGRPFEFSYFPITQYGDAGEGTAADSFSQLLDEFYETREQTDRLRQRGQELRRAAANGRDKLNRKLLLQEKEYAETQHREQLRLYGELITANLYRMERGQRMLTAQNYYDPNGNEVTIPLEPRLSPQENAAKYFKRYAKARAAEGHLREQMDIARRERDWLESVLDELGRAESEADFLDIRRELETAGYLKNREKKEAKRPPSQPRRFRSTTGLPILVGRSNTQNDQLTRDANRYDYWFHAQHLHGAHVILCAQGHTPDAASLTQAAALAAYFSQGQDGNQVAVDYTQVKYVKKPRGARPGMVVYTPYETAYVRPDRELVKFLEDKV